MTRLLIDPAADFDDPGAVTITATLLDPGPSVVRTFTDVTTDTVVDLPAPDTTEAWRLTIRRPVTTINRWNIASTNPGPIVAERTVHFADGDPVAWAALTDVDPTTLRTTTVPSAAWDAAIAELRAEVDNLPASGSGGGFSGAYADLTGAPAIPSTPADIGAATPADITAAIDALDLEALSTGSAVRVSAATLPTWVRKLQLSLLDQGPVRVLCVGDSTTAGVYSDSYTAATGSTNQGGPNSYPARLATYLTAHGIPASYAMGIPGHQSNDDSRWTLSSSGAGYYPMGAGGAAGVELDSGGIVTFTPGVKADRFRLYYFGDPGTGALTAQATGGATTTVTTATAGTGGIYTSADIQAAASSSENVVTIAAATGTTFIVGVEYWDSTAPNSVRILPAGVGSSTANTWAADANTTKYGGLAFVRAVAPDLTIVSLGINDIRAGRTASQVLVDVNTIATAVAISGDVLLVSAVPGPDGSQDTVNAGYLDSPYPYIDLARRYGHDMQAHGLMTGDGTHPNALGYGDVAATIGDALTAVVAGQAVESEAAPPSVPAPSAVRFVAASIGSGGDTAWAAGPGGLTTAPLVLASSSDADAWDATAHAWTIPVTGLYQVTGVLRPTDGYPAGSNIGIGVDSSQNGGPNFIWSGVTAASRHSFQLARTSFFYAGDKVSMFAYFEGAGDVGMAVMTVALVAAD